MFTSYGYSMDSLTRAYAECNYTLTVKLKYVYAICHYTYTDGIRELSAINIYINSDCIVDQLVGNYVIKSRVRTARADFMRLK